LSNVLESFLEFFSCDRAWLLFPCNVNATSTTIPMECTVPEWPGAGAGAEVEGDEFPVDDFGRKVYKMALESSGAVRFDPNENPLDLNHVVIRQYHIRSQLVMAIRPKIGDPWLLGLHHCSVPVTYSDNDCALFEALGNRLSDGLTSLISWKNTRKLFNSAQVSIWNEDLTEIYHALKKLRKDGITDLRSYLEDNTELAWQLADSIQVLQVNDATLKLFGAKSEVDFFHHIGKTFGPHTIDVFINELCAMWDKQSLFRSEAAFRSLGGKNFNAIITFKVPRTAEDYKAVSISIVDITDRKRAEDALHFALVEADRSNRAKSQFLENMSHELRTPLNAILGFAQIMQINRKSPLTPQQNEHIECILNGGNHLLDLINEILDLAKIEANQLDLSLEEINANEIISECLTLVSPLGEKRDILIFNEFNQSENILLRTDQRRLKQVLINLLSNAIKYNIDGGTVHVRGEITGKGFLRISVIDTGIGIHSDDHDKVFQMFHRIGADSMTTREGTGIGLTVTKLLMERMAGSIDFESTKGKGSRFWIELPLALNDKILVWNDEMRVGVDSLDRDHQYLLSLLNRITHEDLDPFKIDKFFEELNSYTQHHFIQEEAVMEACHYPGLKNHRDHHQNIIAELKKLEESWHKNKSVTLIAGFQEDIRSWLFNHIKDKDTGLAKYTLGKDREIRQALESLN
ncbi:hypothetical protein A9Q97_07360, partial [Rhodospirillales bacterium 47_12_T64]